MNFEDHAFRSKSNRDFLDDLEKNNYTQYDWMGTIIFYIALHRVRAKLAKLHNITRDTKMDHKKLNAYVLLHIPLIARDYKLLYDESRRFRYNLKRNNVISKTDYIYVRDLLNKSIIPNTIIS